MDLPPGAPDRLVEAQARARAFCQEVIHPLEPHRAEWIEDHELRFPWAVVEEGSRRGLRTLGVPTAYGGGGASMLELTLVMEEIAFGDMGIAVTFDQVNKLARFIDDIGTEAQKQRFLPAIVEDDRYLLTAAYNDPDHTSDRHLSRRLLEVEDTFVQMSTEARLQDDGWVLNGVKLMPSLGSTASLAVVLAQTEAAEPIHRGTSFFLVPMDTPGVRVSRHWDKISQRLNDNATLIFEDVRVPEDQLLGERGRSAEGSAASGGNLTPAAIAVGCARGAYEAAVAYARQRVQGGRPIVEHQAVGVMLAQMASELEAARSLVWRAAETYDQGDRRSPLLQMATWVAPDTAVKVCLKAMEVFAGVGVLRDEPVQKYMRDALSSLHADGTQQGRLMVVQQLILDGTLVPDLLDS